MRSFVRAVSLAGLLAGCENPALRCSSDQECSIRAGRPSFCDSTRRVCLDLIGADSGVLDAGPGDAGDSDVDASDAGCEGCPKLTWTRTGSPDGGVFPNVVPLGDGRVVIVDLVFFFSSGTQVFHPETGTWTQSSHPTTKHANAPATLLESNNLLVAGGNSRLGPGLQLFVGAASIFDPNVETWTASAGELVTPRGRHASPLLLDGGVLISGGTGTGSTDGGKFAPDFFPPFAEIFNTQSQTFRETGQMVVPREGHSATRLRDGRVLIAGGASATGKEGLAEIYSPTTHTFTATGRMKSEGGRNDAVLLPNGQVIALVHGWGAEVFDPDGGTWRATGPLVQARAESFPAGMSALPDGGVIVCGGNEPAIANCEVYSAPTNSWIATSPLARPRWGPKLVLMQSGKVLCVGGADRLDGGVGEGISEAEIYW